MKESQSLKAKRTVFRLNKQILLLAMPLILSNITIPLLGITNTYISGHLNSEVLMAAIALGGTIFDFLYWPFGFFRMGTVALVAQAYGASDHRRILNVIFHTLVLALVMGIGIVLLQPLILKLVFKVYHHHSEVNNFTSHYISIRILGAPAVFLNLALIGSFIGLQDTKSPLILSMTVNIIAIILSLLLSFKFNLSLNGIALGDVIGQYAGMIVGLWRMFNRLHHIKYHQSFYWQLKWTIFKKLLVINKDIFLRTCCLISAFSFFTLQSYQLGPLYLAANAIILHFMMLMGNAQDGFANVAESLIGESVGKLDYQSATQVTFDAGIWVMIIALVCSVSYFLFGQQFLNTMTDISSIRELANHYQIFGILIPLVTVWCFFFDGVFIGSAKFSIMRNTMLLSFLGYIAVWWLFQSYDNWGLWIAMMSFFIFRGLTMGIYFWIRHAKRCFFFSPSLA